MVTVRGDRARWIQNVRWNRRLGCRSNGAMICYTPLVGMHQSWGARPLSQESGRAPFASGALRQLCAAARSAYAGTVKLSCATPQQVWPCWMVRATAQEQRATAPRSCPCQKRTVFVRPENPTRFLTYDVNAHSRISAARVTRTGQIFGRYNFAYATTVAMLLPSHRMGSRVSGLDLYVYLFQLLGRQLDRERRPRESFSTPSRTSPNRIDII